MVHYFFVSELCFSEGSKDNKEEIIVCVWCDMIACKLSKGKRRQGVENSSVLLMEKLSSANSLWPAHILKALKLLPQLGDPRFPVAALITPLARSMKW